MPSGMKHTLKTKHEEVFGSKRSLLQEQGSFVFSSDNYVSYPTGIENVNAL